MPAEYYLDTIKTVFQDFALVNGTWEVDGELVRPQDITTTALLTIEGELDDISGAGQTTAAHDAVHRHPEGAPVPLRRDGAGHYGIFSGRRWREQVYPEVRDFIARYSRPTQPAQPAEARKRAAGREGDARRAERTTVRAGDTPCRSGCDASTTRCRRRSARAAAIPTAAATPRPSPPAKPTSTSARPAAPKASRGSRRSPADPVDAARRRRAASKGPRRLAVIDEAWCIGCTLCIKACPVDCIVGAPKRMHTVIDALCTGCELCMPVCPVDCIAMQGTGSPATGWEAWSEAQAAQARHRYAPAR